MPFLDSSFGWVVTVVGVGLLLFGIGREICFRRTAQTGLARVAHKWSKIDDDEEGRREAYYLVCGLVEDG
jgi:hypothetical protein